MGPELTGEANPGPEGSPTRRTRVCGCCRGSGSCSDSTLSLRLGDAPCFGCTGSIGGITAPIWRASVSHVLMSTPRSLRDTLRLSL